jgi:Ca-activated chloride channel family protein
MEASIRLEHDLLAVETDNTVHAMLELTAPALAPAGDRPGLELAVVVDRSGSMAGPKLETTKRCVDYLIRRLTVKDRISLIAYDDSVLLLSPLSGADKRALRTVAASIHPGGMTNLSGGWLKGREQLAGAASNGARKILLLTDGLANRGIVDRDALIRLTGGAHQAGIGTTTIGFGDDFDEELLTAMADAGGGNSYYAANPEEAPGIFAREFEGLARLVAQNVSVEIVPTEHVEILGVLNEYPLTTVRSGLQAAVGDVYAEEARRVVFKLRVPQMARLGVVRIADVVVRYVSVGDEIASHELTIPMHVNMVSADDATAVGPDAEVRDEVVVLEAARAKKEARRLADSGDFSAAQNYMRLASTELRSWAPNSADPERMQAEADELFADLDALQPDLWSPSASREMWYGSHARHRGRATRSQALVRLAADAAMVDVDAKELRGPYRGVLLGAAVGNALGLLVEGWSRTEIAQRYPNGVRGIDPRERTTSWDDDVAQTVMLADCLIECGRFDADDFASRLVRWARSDGRGMGVLTAEVIDRLAADASPMTAARDAWEASGRTSAGNGAAMRFSPVALRYRQSPDQLIAAAAAQTRVTHHDPRCVWSTVAVTVALARRLSGLSTDLVELAGALRTDGTPSEVVESVKSVPGATLTDFELDDSAAMSYTLKAMQVGLWCLDQTGSFEDLLVQAISAGGDADTNGAVAGAILGAAGEPAIPEQWLEAVSGPDVLRRRADLLLSVTG